MPYQAPEFTGYSEESRELRQRREQEADRRKRAEAKARGLLLSKLTGEQKHSLEAFRHFGVTGSKGGRYRIECTSRTANVKRGAFAYCAGPHGVPDSDFWLAQKLLIESDEEAFLEIAVRYGPDPSYRLQQMYWS